MATSASGRSAPSWAASLGWMATPATIDGQRYEVVVENAVDRPSSTGEEVRYVISGQDRLKVQGNEDGSVTIPDVLLPYMGGLKKIEKAS